MRRGNEIIRIVVDDQQISGEIVGLTGHSMTVRMLEPYPGLMSTIPRHTVMSPDDPPRHLAETGLATLCRKAAEFLARKDEINAAFDEAMARIATEGLGESREQAFDSYTINRAATVARRRNRELTGREAEMEIARIRSRLVARYAELAKVEEDLCRDIFGATLSLSDVRALRDHFRDAETPSQGRGLRD
ncbi:MAG: hypothetical protein E4H09_02635 [Spirochaetales bacterium]|nr:MAG: hypothetical protein E4H09_02635 [Spirochaetales bacterium]